MPKVWTLRAARDQQARARLLAVEPGEAEQAGPAADRHRHLEAADLDRRQPREPLRSATRAALTLHMGPASASDSSPGSGANPRSGTAAGMHAATMIGMIFERFRWAAEA